MVVGPLDVRAGQRDASRPGTNKVKGQRSVTKAAVDQKTAEMLDTES